jgi:putative intracellular protease/amidase
MATVLLPLPEHDFEPTEAALVWRALVSAGHEVVFATPAGEPAACDPLALEGVVFGTIGAKPAHAAVYREMLEHPAYRRPLSWRAIQPGDLDALHLSGGHAPGMKPYLESAELKACVVEMFAADKPVCAVCHGPVLLARAIDPATGRSVIAGRRATALTRMMERSAWWLTRWTLGDHFRTYPTWVQDEVEQALSPGGSFQTGPLVPSYARPFTVRDGNLLTGRWPGDVERLARDFVAMLGEAHPTARPPAPSVG